MSRAKGTKNKAPITEQGRKNMAEARRGKPGNNCKAVSVNGVEYPTSLAAAKANQVSTACVHNRLNNQKPKWSAWFYL